MLYSETIHTTIENLRDHEMLNLNYFRFNTRAYRDPKERWQVAAGCLKLFSKVLNEYSPHPSDFVKTSALTNASQDQSMMQQQQPLGKHPGFALLADLLQVCCSSCSMRLYCCLVPAEVEIL